MTTQTSNDLYDQLEEDPWRFLQLSQEELFDLDYDRVEQFQLALFKRRFEALKPKLRALQRLAEEVGIDEVSGFEDLTRLAMPHTMFKSYSALDVQKARFDKLTRWLQALTTHDLSAVHAEHCESIEQWLLEVERVTPLRPVTSSGTSGKISLFPLSTVEESLFVDKNTYIVEPYRDEPGIYAKSGEYVFVCPWPSRYGRHNIPLIMRVLKENCYDGREDMFITLDDGTLTADEMWLNGRLQRAQALGEELELSPAEQAIASALATRASNADERWTRFIENAVVGLKGQKVMFYGAIMNLYLMAEACRKMDIFVEWHPDSMIMTGGGTKGFSFPEGWRDVVAERFPHHVPARVKEVYGMTESSSTAVCCPHDKLHPLPWGITHLMDPATGQSLPRTGTQTGRMVVFDPMPTTFWAGVITGDQVTVHFDGGCACGRKGPFMDNDINRISELNGGDDKIVCARTPQAFQSLEDFLAKAS